MFLFSPRGHRLAQTMVVLVPRSIEFTSRTSDQLHCRTSETSLFVPDLVDAFFLGLSHLPLAVVLCEFPWARGQRISTPESARVRRTDMHVHAHGSYSG